MKFEPFSFISTEFDQHDENVKIISREAGGKTCTSVSYLLRKNLSAAADAILGECDFTKSYGTLLEVQDSVQQSEAFRRSNSK